MVDTKKLLNAKLSHKKFGTGKVVAVNDNHLTVSFDSVSEQKVFTYPDAFEKFLRFEEEPFQKIFDSDWREHLLVSQLEKNRKLQEYHKMEVEKKRERIALMRKKQKAALAKLEREKRQRLAQAAR